LCYDDIAHDCFAVFPEDGQNEEMFIQTDVFKSIEAEILKRTDMIKREASAKPTRLNIF
jgi:hypothetical protein